MPNVVLIFGHRNDFGVDAVVEELDRLGERVFRLDFADIPKARLTASLTTTQERVNDSLPWNTSLSTAFHSLNLKDVKSVWFWHPREISFSGTIPWQADLFVQQEVRYAIGGLTASHRPFFVNDPQKESAGLLKPYQLAQAAGVGLRVPRSLITNDPDRLEPFLLDCGEVVCKALGGVPSVTTEGERAQRGVPTSRITADDLRYAETIRWGPCFFQELIRSEFQLRVTVVGGRVLTARMDATRSDIEPIDWRLRDDLVYSSNSLPASVEEQVTELMTILGLQFAAIDMAVTESGEYFFLDLNPRGQWGRIQAMTDLPIASSIARLLARAGSS